MQAFLEVPVNRLSVQLDPRKPHITVWPQQVEGDPGNPRPRQLAFIGRIVWHRIGAQQVAQARHSARQDGLPEYDQGESGVVELLVEVLLRAVSGEFEP